jgi:hypothetical protein
MRPYMKPQSDAGELAFSNDFRFCYGVMRYFERSIIMNHGCRGKMMHWYRRARLHFLISVGVIVLAMSVSSIAANEANVDYFKMISTLEYTGDGQFRNQTESAYSVTKEMFANDRVRYSFSMLDPNSKPGKKASSEFSFVIDKSTGLMSAAGRDMSFWARVNNETIKSLDKVTKDYVGKTWKQSVDLASVDGCPVNEITFTLTAIDVRTKAFGDMTAVRALSEPFFVTVDKGPLRCRINTVCLFDSSMEDVYLCISVFDAATDARGTRETFRNEVATYRTDAAGKPYDLSDVGRDFEALVARVGLRKDTLQITKETDLPKWARDEGVTVAQVSNICSSAVCEGALNPVGLVSMQAARVLSNQAGVGGAAGGGSLLGKLLSGFGWNLPTVGVVTAAIAVPVILAQDDDSKSRPASP